MTRIFVCGCVALAIAAWDPAPACAQDRYQDATAASYGLAVFEITLAASLLMAESVQGPRWDEQLGLIALYVGLVVGGTAITSIVAGVTGAPAEVPLVWHGALAGAASLGALGAALGYAVAGDGGVWAAVIGGALGLIGGSIWTALRAGDLTHDPARLGPAHLLTWAPLASAGLALAVTLAATDGDVGLAALVAGLVGGALTGAAIAWSEALPAPVAMTTDMVSLRF